MVIDGGWITACLGRVVLRKLFCENLCRSLELMVVELRCGPFSTLASSSAGEVGVRDFPSVRSRTMTLHSNTSLSGLIFKICYCDVEAFRDF